jgi:hypothetical protein
MQANQLAPTFSLKGFSPYDTNKSANVTNYGWNDFGTKARQTLAAQLQQDLGDNSRTWRDAQGNIAGLSAEDIPTFDGTKFKERIDKRTPAQKLYDRNKNIITQLKTFQSGIAADGAPSLDLRADFTNNFFSYITAGLAQWDLAPNFGYHNKSGYFVSTIRSSKTGKPLAVSKKFVRAWKKSVTNPIVRAAAFPIVNAMMQWNNAQRAYNSISKAANNDYNTKPEYATSYLKRFSRAQFFKRFKAPKSAEAITSSLGKIQLNAQRMIQKMETAAQPGDLWRPNATGATRYYIEKVNRPKAEASTYVNTFASKYSDSSKMGFLAGDLNPIFAQEFTLGSRPLS